MIEADATLSLLTALSGGASIAELSGLLRRPELKRVFPAMGIPTDRGLQYLEAVLDPPRRERLDEPGRQVVAYVLELVRLRGEFEVLLRKFREVELPLTTAAFAATREFLPDSCDLGEIRFVFLPIGLDFRTDQQSVYMDPLAALQYGLDGIRRTLSHEFHHVARYRWTGVTLTLMRMDEERPPQSTLEILRDWSAWLEAEGIADCVSKATDVEIPALTEALKERRRQLEEYGALLEGALGRLRNALAGEARSEADRVTLRHELLQLAHPVGSQMAERIYANRGRPALVECVGNPALFVRRYSTIAREQGLVEFDDNLLRLLEAV
jgi:hypothetical protein